MLKIKYAHIMIIHQYNINMYDHFYRNYNSWFKIYHFVVSSFFSFFFYGFDSVTLFNPILHSYSSYNFSICCFRFMLSFYSFNIIFSRCFTLPYFGLFFSNYFNFFLYTNLAAFSFFFSFSVLLNNDNNFYSYFFNSLISFDNFGTF